MDRRPCWTAGSAFALAVLALATPASASTEVYERNGVSYVIEATTATMGNDLSDAITADCPTGGYPLSGGFFSGGGFSDILITGSVPVNAAGADPAPDAWTGSWRGSPSAGYSLWTSVACDEAKPRYFTDTTTVKPQRRKAIEVGCPNSRHVYGGGIGSELLQPGPLLVSSHPIDDGDTGRAPDDGWRASVENESVTAVDVTAYANCGAANPKYVKSKTREIRFDSFDVRRDCPDSKPTLVGGGQKLGGGYGQNGVETSGAVVAGGEFPGWSATIFRFDPEPEKARAFAICVGESTLD